MNPNLAHLHAYPFQRLRELFYNVQPTSSLSPVDLSIGEPKHTAPGIVKSAICSHLAGLSSYPATAGTQALRDAITRWLTPRFKLQHLDANQHVLPVNGSREALFAIAQAVVDTSKPEPFVVMPNPFYQIYEGAALLAGAQPYFVNTCADHGFRMRFEDIPEQVLRGTQLMYICSPGNPTGQVLSLADWAEVFELSDRHHFVIASDECYSEIYDNEADPPLGALEASERLGRADYRNLLAFGSLSKRSNVPGLRSGFVAGDAQLIKAFLLYRTYHGCAMSPLIQEASIAAWNDEVHVVDNRRAYREKFDAVLTTLRPYFDVARPPGSFYLWLPTRGSDTDFAKGLYRDYNVTVLPGSFLSRVAHGVNPGSGYVRVALVAPLDQCIDAAERIAALASALDASSLTTGTS